MTNTGGLNGVVPIIPTPFTEKEEIDETALRDLIEFAVSSGVKAVCLPAYASEFYKLTDEEKIEVVKIAVNQASGRLQIVAQSNSPSLKIAIGLAKRHISNGAQVISIAIPRLFSLPETSLMEYLGEFLASISNTPVLIQDFNPGGSSISVPFVNELRKAHANFKYLKLEEPLVAEKFRNIISVTEGKVGVLEGWGGLYLMELVPVGITGVMPGLGVADILQSIFDSRKNGDDETAFRLFERVMPQIFFSLQNLELFHYAEKELLIARGVLKNSRSRKAAFVPDDDTKKYINELNRRILDLIDEMKGTDLNADRDQNIIL